jgi:hypothetical protein
VTPTYNNGSVNCTGLTKTFTVTVNPTPSVTTANTAAICSGTGPNISLIASVASSFTWTVGTITGSITGASAGSGATINQTLTNPSNSTAGSVQYIVTPTANTGSCAGSPYTITVTVRPNFTAGAIKATGETICYNGNPDNITSPTAASGGDNIITYKWQANGVDIASSNAATYDPPANLTTTTTYTRYAKDNTCNTTFTLSAGSRLVTVQSVPTAGTISASQTICNGGDPAAFTGTVGTGSGTITYRWESSTGTFATWNTIGGATAATYNAPSGLTATTQYRRTTISTLNGVACESNPTATVQVTVQSVPTAGAIGTNQTICNGNTPAALTSTTAGTGLGAITYEWQVDLGSGYATISSANSATYAPGALILTRSYKRRTVSTLNGVICYSDYTLPVTITVQSDPTAGAIGTAQIICLDDTPAPLTSTTAGTGSVGASITYEWQTNASGSYVTIGLANAATYAPPALTATTSYQRITVSTLNGEKCYSGYTNEVTITIDTQPPTFTAPVDTFIDKSDVCGYDASLLNITGDVTNESDNGSTGLEAEYSDVISDINPGETIITRTWSLVDLCRNAADDQIQTITVLDNIDPAAICQNITVDVDHIFTWEDINNGSTDNCGIPYSDLGYKLSKTSFNCSEVGDHTVTLTVTDYNGNTDTCEAIVTVSPMVIDGGSITGHNYYINGEPDGPEAEIINVTACPENQIKSALLTLAGNDGVVDHWEYSYNSGATWDLVDNNPTLFTYTDATKTAITYTNIVKTTIFRARLTVGSCVGVGLSAAALVNVIPPDVKPSVDFNTAHICIGDPITVNAASEYANNILLDEGGLFDQANPEDWRLNYVLGETKSYKFPANADSEVPTIWAETNGPKDFGGITYDTRDNTKFAIAYGDFAGDQFGSQTWNQTYTTMETPVFNSLGLTELYLEFDQAYFLEAGASIKIEISLDGGVTYPEINPLDPLGPSINPLDPGYNDITLADHKYIGPSNSGTNTFKYDINIPNSGFVHTKIDLNDYIGQTNLRVRFTFEGGGTTNSSWAIDNISVPDRHVDEIIEWTDEFGNHIIYGFTAIITPVSPGYQHIGATSIIDECRSVDNIGTQRIEVFADYAYAGKIYISDDNTTKCGEKTVILNAYDNEKSSNQNKFEGAWDTNLETETFKPSDIPGSVFTGMTGTFEGTWTAVSTSACTGVSDLTDFKFGNIHDPKSTFTGEAGDYTLTWTTVRTYPYIDINGDAKVGEKICSDDVNVTITNCGNVNFDGVDDYVDFTNIDNTNYNLTNPNFSIEVWVKSNQLSSNIQTIFSKRNSNSLSGSGYDLRLVDNVISFNWGAGGSITSSPDVIGTDRWYHIAVTFDGGTYRLYIDGIEVINQPGSAPLTTTSHCLLGAMHNVNPSDPRLETTNHFNGWMDELRIWNVTLTPEQLHQMMNQEIKASSGTAVIGATVPVLVNGLNWSDLEGYYQMGNDCGFLLPTAGTINGKLRNIFEPLEQTAPIPYTSITDGDWTNVNKSGVAGSSTWLWGHSVWDYPNSTGINGEPIDWNIVETSHLVDVNRDLTLLGLVSKAGKLTINGTTNADGKGTGKELWITKYLELDGIIDLQGESQLVQKRYPYTPTQVSESVLDADSGGYIERDQQGTANSFNYNYWSSSVGPISGDIANRGDGVPSTNNSQSVSGFLRDGTTPSSPAAISYNTPYTWADYSYSGLKRISTYWLYTFNGTDDDYWSWNPISQNTPILAGEGYTMKGTSGTVSISTLQNYVFKGKPYNGDFTLYIAPGDDRLIGNPYPSAMDADEFIKENIKVTINGKVGRNAVNIFNGALYYWDHFGEINTHVLREYVGGYATYTLIGGTKAIASDTRINTTSGLSSWKEPQQYIPVNQGFFVIAALDTDLTGSTGSVSGGDIVFKNSQRAFITEGTGSSVFMKSASPKNEAAKSYTDDDIRPKIWLMYDSPNGYHRQLLIGADENTTNGFDIGFDGLIADVGKEDMFWTIEGAKFVIQGVNNFNEDQEFPLGIKVAKAGLVRIKIDEIKNIDENTVLFIKDKFTGKAHNISYQPFEIELEPGTYLDRFSLIFRIFNLMEDDVASGLLLVEPLIEDNNYHVFMNNAIAELQIKNNGTDEIINIALYNNLGQTMRIWNTELNRRIISLPLKLATGVYMVQINTLNGTINKRIIIE